MVMMAISFGSIINGSGGLTGLVCARALGSCPGQSPARLSRLPNEMFPPLLPSLLSKHI